MSAAFPSNTETDLAATVAFRLGLCRPSTLAHVLPRRITAPLASPAADLTEVIDLRTDRRSLVPSSSAAA